MTFGDSVSRPSPESITDASIKIDHQYEYHVRDLPTRSVTLFPTSAQVVRDIKNVPLKAGSSQITIIGVTPTLDEHSVKVEGTGHVMITDLAIDLLNNREDFDDVFTELNDVDSKSDDPDANMSERDENPELEAALDKMRRLLVEEKSAQEVVHSAVNRLQILDIYGRSIAASKEGSAKTSFEDGLEVYRKEREKIFRDHLEGEARVQAIVKEITCLQKATDRLHKRADKDHARAHAAKDKEREKQRRKNREQAKEVKRVRKEQEMYWPKKVYLITVNIYVKATSDDTDGDADVSACDLTLSYVTTHAFWSPTYDMALSTTTDSGVLCFDAHLTNQTSETWNDCKIVLSTSQKDFSGIGDSAPTLVPWRISLAWKDQTRVTTGIMYSGEEMKVQPTREPTTRLHWQEMFGVERPSPQVNQNVYAKLQRSQWGEDPPHMGVVAASSQSRVDKFVASNQNPSRNKEAPANTAFGRAAGGLFGQTQTAAANRVSIFDVANQRASVQGTSKKSGDSSANGWRFDQVANRSAFDADDYGTPVSLQPGSEFKESSFEEIGLATTYSLKGLKSLSPSSTASRHRVARITYAGVVFSRVVVAKHMRVVFLKAKVLNDSGLVLPKGRTGLILDGSFLGRAMLPHCIVGDTFPLSLGIDPSIEVIYPRPEVEQSVGSMVFSAKENSSLFTRSIILVNNRNDAQGKPVQITVFDQMPITEDERIRIMLVKPGDLVVNGPSVSTGESGDHSNDNNEWGKAEAKLKKGGEIEWTVTVNPGCSAKLSLAYSCVVPSGSEAINAYSA
ncbi:hypothetical protein GGR58DRAFT_495139 [Xylaria digitata]|nr:hypothetical protein GGR58DRAFT_495139 [Xylaria digitata]